MGTHLCLFHHFTKGTNFFDLHWATFKQDFGPREANNFFIELNPFIRESKMDIMESLPVRDSCWVGLGGGGGRFVCLWG